MTAEPKGYVYRILVLSDASLDGKRSPHYLTMGDFRGHTPDEAIRVAAEERGTPSDSGGLLVAVPLRNWHERQVRRRVEPVYDIAPPLERAEPEEGE